MNRFVAFLKKEAVLVAAFVLAVISCFFVKPNAGYLGYIDFNTLFLLFSLMCVMAGFKELGFFESCSVALLGRVHGFMGIICILVFLPFLFSMVITNDVALITFVPLALVTLKISGEEKAVVPVAVMQTIAANLGSMMLPMGNPQNLYLYNVSGIGFGEFIGLMLPYTAMSFALILFSLLGIYRWKRVSDRVNQTAVEKENLSLDGGKKVDSEKNEGSGKKEGFFGSVKFKWAVNILAFVLCMLSVLKVVPPLVLFIVILVVYLVCNRKLVARVDYSLLLTFVGFFIFVGNIKNMDGARNFLAQIVGGREVLVSVAASQVISNVPAALLLSGFTENLKGLIIGTNLGGLGTLIASMASLISFKQIAAAYPEKKGKYFGFFTLMNIVFLILLLGFNFLLVI